MIYFSSFHPFVTAAYFISVLLFLMFSTHPLLLFPALLSGILFRFQIERPRRIGKTLGFYCFVFLLVTFSNPLFSRNGVTPLFYFNGNAVTLEAVLYGADLSVMLLSVLCWFTCLNCVMTSDKLLYLLGRVSPKSALLLSSSLRMIPLFRLQAQRIRQAQKAMGLFSSESWTDRVRSVLRMFSSLISWALEYAIDLGAAMKSRGYGLAGRTHYSLFRFQKSDLFLLLILFSLDLIVLFGMASGALSFQFYPSISAPPLSPIGIFSIGAFTLLVFLPYFLERKEAIRWNYYRSKI